MSLMGVKSRCWQGEKEGNSVVRHDIGWTSRTSHTGTNAVWPHPRVTSKKLNVYKQGRKVAARGWWGEGAGEMLLSGQFQLAAW